MEIGGRDIPYPTETAFFRDSGLVREGISAGFTPRSCLRGHGVLGTLASRPQMGRQGRCGVMRAGHPCPPGTCRSRDAWIPAFAGMTRTGARMPVRAGRKRSQDAVPKSVRERRAWRKPRSAHASTGRPTDPVRRRAARGVQREPGPPPRPTRPLPQPRRPRRPTGRAGGRRSARIGLRTGFSRPGSRCGRPGIRRGSGPGWRGGSPAGG